MTYLALSLLTSSQLITCCIAREQTALIAPTEKSNQNFSDRGTAEYSNIGINKIDSMLRVPNCPFVLFVGTKKLVKRREFEEYISQKLVI